MDRPLKSPGLHALEEAFHRQFELSRSEPAPTLQARLDRLRRLRAPLTEDEVRLADASSAALGHRANF